MMSEWHVTPEYIINNWTDELLDLMLEKLIERKSQTSKEPESPKVSDELLFAQANNLIKVDKK